MGESAINKEDWTSVHYICEVRPDLSYQWSHQLGYYEGKYDSCVLPIHHALTLSNPSVLAIQSLIDSYPGGLKLGDSRFDRLPLHLACMHSVPIDIIRYMLSYYAESASKVDLLGRLPIHYSLSNGSDPETISALLNAYPEAASCADKDGWLPMHVAIDCGARYETIKILIDAYPDSASCLTNKGNSPLNLLLKRKGNKDYDRILYLVKTVPLITYLD